MKNDLGLYCSLVLVMNIGMCAMAAFDKLWFYIIKRHKGNKNMCICVEMYGEACTFSAIGQQVICLEFPNIPGSNI